MLLPAENVLNVLSLNEQSLCKILCLKHDGIHADRQLKCSVVLKVTYMYTHSVRNLLELISGVGISNAWPASAFDTALSLVLLFPVV